MDSALAMGGGCVLKDHEVQCNGDVRKTQIWIHMNIENIQNRNKRSEYRM